MKPTHQNSKSKQKRYFVKAEVSLEERNTLERMAKSSDLTMSDLIRASLKSAKIIVRSDYKQQAIFLAKITNYIYRICEFSEHKLSPSNHIKILEGLINLERTINSLANTNRGTK
ncbi:plasmid mobilization protein [Paramagnetospirillum caucaseum]|uniref:plasmid mobilization protein n=1 Tax=Paramagnetospirillum caucaseum TaxID=1244869 RepID=UPI003899354A